MRKRLALALILSLNIPARADITLNYSQTALRFENAGKKKSSPWKPVLLYWPLGGLAGGASGLALSSIAGANLQKHCLRQIQFSGTAAGIMGGLAGGALQGLIGGEKKSPLPVLAGAGLPAPFALILHIKGSRFINPLFAGLFGGVSAFISSSLVRYLETDKENL